MYCVLPAASQLDGGRGASVGKRRVGAGCGREARTAALGDGDDVEGAAADDATLPTSLPPRCMEVGACTVPTGALRALGAL